MSALLEVRKVSRAFNSTIAVKDVSFVVEKGEARRPRAPITEKAKA